MGLPGRSVASLVKGEGVLEWVWLLLLQLPWGGGRGEKGVEKGEMEEMRESCEEGVVGVWQSGCGTELP